MSSFLDELQAVRERVREHASKTLDVPGSGGRLAVRFRPPPPHDSEARTRLAGIVAAYRIGSGIDAATEKQLIVDCCDEILKKNEDGELARDGDSPLRFDASDERWGGDVETAHDCVAKLYNLAEQPLATSGQADLLVDWLQGLDAEIAARVEGNSLHGGASSS